MIRVCNLPGRWTLYAVEGPREFGGWVGVFGHPSLKHTVKPFDLAQMEGSRAVFNALKREIDIMDRTWRLPGEDPRFKAADSAKAILEESLRMHGKWSSDLLYTGIGA